MLLGYGQIMSSNLCGRKRSFKNSQEDTKCLHEIAPVFCAIHTKVNEMVTVAIIVQTRSTILAGKCREVVSRKTTLKPHRGRSCCDSSLSVPILLRQC